MTTELDTTAQAELLRKSVSERNAMMGSTRLENPAWRADLSGAVLSGADLRDAVGLSPAVPEPISREDNEASEWARILQWVECDAGARMFAGDLAYFGTNPAKLRMMADRWVEVGYVPAKFADVLNESADTLSGWRS